MTNLPKDSRSQEIGRLAARALGLKLPKSWIETSMAFVAEYQQEPVFYVKNDMLMDKSPCCIQ